MSAVIWRRIVWEQRVRLPLIVTFAFAWGLLLVTLFGHLSPAERNLGPEQVQIALRLLGIDALAAWVTVGQEHPLFLGASTLFLVGGGVRAIAGELEGGTLELVLARPVSRVRYLLSWIAVLVPGRRGDRARVQPRLHRRVGALPAVRRPPLPGEHARERGLHHAPAGGDRGSEPARVVPVERARPGARLGGRVRRRLVRLELPPVPRGHAPSVRPPLPVVVLRAGLPHPARDRAVARRGVLAAIALATGGLALGIFARRDLA